MLFRHASMQIRHCCQNLNLLPYLLYSFDNSKSHPVVRRVHICLSRLLHDVIISVLLTYGNLRQSVLAGFRTQKATKVQKSIVETNNDPAAKFNKFEKPKRKRHPLGLIAAVYFVPLLLIFQTTALCGLTIISKYTPGFFFLITALLFLGGIALKILLYGTVLYGIDKCKMKKKVQ